VVAVHEVGEHDGQVFLAMELVEGPTLRGWLDARPRGFAEKLRLLVEAGRGLEAAHRAGLVHRDFKPENVLVGSDGRARVVDFGLAAIRGAEPWPRPISSPSGDDGGARLATPLTVDGAIIGTPAYMAPEQFLAEPATPLSDQCSFCVTLFRAVYGKPPFPLDSLPMLHAAFERPLAPPPARPDVPPWLFPIIARGLSRDPAARFPSMTALLDEIERNVPRDPELDPSPVLRERKLLSAFFIVAYAMTGASLLVPAGARWMMTPGPMLGLTAGASALLGSLIALRREQLARNRYGKRLAVIFLATVAALLGNRLVGLHLGLRPEHIVLEDEVLQTGMMVMTALLFDGWLIALAALSAATVVAGSIWPAHVAPIVGGQCVAWAAAMGVRLYVDRHVASHPGAGTDEESPRSALLSGSSPTVALETPPTSPSPSPSKNQAGPRAAR
jgi:serine/threonine-protein kinase